MTKKYITRIQALAQDFNPDVDRALLALAASPMPYRSFVSAPVGPGGTGQVVSPVVTPEQSAESQRALGFPLLIAALPEIADFSLPRVPVVENTNLPRVQAPVQESGNVASLSSQPAANSIRPRPKAPPLAVQPRYEPARPAPRQYQTASFSDSRGADSRGADSQGADSRGANSRGGTNLSNVFHGLQTEKSSRGERAEAKSDLQEMFSRL